MSYICPKCGAKNKSGSEYCRVCGRILGEGVVKNQPKHYRSGWGFLAFVLLIAVLILSYPAFVSRLPLLAQRLHNIEALLLSQFPQTNSTATANSTTTNSTTSANSTTTRNSTTTPATTTQEPPKVNNTNGSGLNMTVGAPSPHPNATATPISQSSASSSSSTTQFTTTRLQTIM